MSDESSAPKTDEFEALIDLLAMDDGESSALTSQSFEQDGTQPVFSAQRLVFATVGSNLRISPELPYRETPMELNGVRSLSLCPWYVFTTSDSV